MTRDKMNGKTAIVTGAASGIGAAVVRRLAAAGARVMLLDVNEDAGRNLADALEQTFIRCNVADREDWTRALNECVARAGVPDYAVLNAGVMSVPASEPFVGIEALPLARYRRIVSVNLDGVVFGLQELLPRMRRAGGAITVTASMAGLIPLPVDPLYSATKHALVGLVRSVAAADPDSNLRINAICPGGVDTAIVPAALREAGMAMLPPDEIAREITDLLENGRSGEIRVRLDSGTPAFAADAPDLVQRTRSA